MSVIIIIITKPHYQQTEIVQYSFLFWRCGTGDGVTSANGTRGAKTCDEFPQTLKFKGLWRKFKTYTNL